MSSHTEINVVASTVDGILQVETLADVDPNSEVSTGEDSKVGENLKICSWRSVTLRMKREYNKVYNFLTMVNKDL
jgi:hypothetical protein